MWKIDIIYDLSCFMSRTQCAGAKYMLLWILYVLFIFNGYVSNKAHCSHLNAIFWCVVAKPVQSGQVHWKQKKSQFDNFVVTGSSVSCRHSCQIDDLLL